METVKIVVVQETEDVKIVVQNLSAPADGTGGATNLSIGPRTATTLTVRSDTGTDATLPAASATEAGLMTAAAVVALEGKAEASHAHAISGVTGLQDALDGKAATSHAHAISAVTGLQSALDGKQAALAVATQAEMEAGTETAIRAISPAGVAQAIAAQASEGTGGSGTVTSVAISGSDGIEVDSGSPIIASGTIALGINAATLKTTLGLDTAAYQSASAFATATQGGKADTAIQPAALAGGTITPAPGALDLRYCPTSALGTAAGADVEDFDAAGAAATAAGAITLSGLGGVPATRAVSAGTGLSGGGDLSENRSFAVAYGSTAGTACQGNDARIATERLIFKVSPGNGTIVAGTKISGVFRLAENRTFVAVGAWCDPANKPASAAIQMDLNVVHATTGAETSLLSSIASIAIGASTGTGAISGTTYAYTAEAPLAIDVDQGDGKGVFFYIDTTIP